MSLTALWPQYIISETSESSERDLQLSSQYLTAAEVAAMLRVSPQAVSAWCRQGKLKAIRAGRGWRILPADLHEFTQTQREDQGMSKKVDGLALAH